MSGIPILLSTGFSVLSSLELRIEIFRSYLAVRPHFLAAAVKFMTMAGSNTSVLLVSQICKQKDRQEFENGILGF